MAWLPDHSHSAALRYDQQAEEIMLPIAKALVQEARVRAGDTVLDLLCQVGYAAREAAVAAGPLGAVTGADNEPTLLDIARTHGAGYAIEWVRSECDQLPIPSASIDIVLNQHSMAGISNRRSCLREALRVVKPSGKFFATVWGGIEESPYLAAQARALSRVNEEDGVALLRERTDYGPVRYASDLRHVGWRDVHWDPISVQVEVPANANDLAKQLRALPWGESLDEDQALRAARGLRAELTPRRTTESISERGPAELADGSLALSSATASGAAEVEGDGRAGTLTTSLTIAMLRAYA